MRDEKVLVRLITLYVCAPRRRDVPRAQRIPRHVPHDHRRQRHGEQKRHLHHQTIHLARHLESSRTIAVKQNLERVQSRGDVLQLVARADDGGRRREITREVSTLRGEGHVSIRQSERLVEFNLGDAIATGAGDDGLDAADGDVAAR